MRQLDIRIDRIPAAYNDNDQVKYSGLYVAQEMAAACSNGKPYKSRGHGCFHFLHDGVSRCAGVCSGSHSLQHRMAIDRSNTLFENMYHAGGHSVNSEGRLVKNGHPPVVLHYNGPSKVIFEEGWKLPWDPKCGKTPVLLHGQQFECFLSSISALLQHTIKFDVFPAALRRRC